MNNMAIQAASVAANTTTATGSIIDPFNGQAVSTAMNGQAVAATGANGRSMRGATATAVKGN
jgi:hypothetical protein